MNKEVKEHYLEKYPGGRVHMSDDAIDVYDQYDRHVVAARKNGAGVWNCEGERFGCPHKHDLSPLASDKVKHLVKGRVRAQWEVDADEKAAAQAAADEAKRKAEENLQPKEKKKA